MLQQEGQEEKEEMALVMLALLGHPPEEEAEEVFSIPDQKVGSEEQVVLVQCICIGNHHFITGELFSPDRKEFYL